MAVSRETYWAYQAPAEMPPPGTAEHLGYLSGLKIPDNIIPQELPGFLLAHRATESIATFVRDNQTPYEVGTLGRVSLDSRVLRGPDPKLPLIRAVLTPSSRGVLLALHGSPSPSAESGSTYDLLMRLDYQDSLPPDPMIEASIFVGTAFNTIMVDDAYNPGQLKAVKRFNLEHQARVYRPYALMHPENHPEEQDPKVFADAFRELLRGLVDYSYECRDQGAIILALQKRVATLRAELYRKNSD